MKENEKLDQKFLQKQKTILLKEKIRLEKELKRADKFPQYGTSEEENSAEVSEFTEQQGLERDLQKIYQDVITALERMKKRKYGICTIGKEPIHKNRLKAFPAAVTCVKHTKA